MRNLLLTTAAVAAALMGKKSAVIDFATFFAESLTF